MIDRKMFTPAGEVTELHLNRLARPEGFEPPTLRSEV